MGVPFKPAAKSVKSLLSVKTAEDVIQKIRDEVGEGAASIAETIYKNKKDIDPQGLYIETRNRLPQNKAATMTNMPDMVAENAAKLKEGDLVNSKSTTGATDYTGPDMPTPDVTGLEVRGTTAITDPVAERNVQLAVPQGGVKTESQYSPRDPNRPNLPARTPGTAVLDPLAEQKGIKEGVPIGEPRVSKGPSRLTPEEAAKLREEALYDTASMNKDPLYLNGSSSARKEMIAKATRGERAKKLLAAAGVTGAVGGAIVAGSQTKSPGQASEGTGMSGGGEEEVPKTPKQKQKSATSEVQQAKASGKPATSGEAKVYQYSYNIETPEDIATSMKTAKSLADELSPSNKKEYELRLKVLEDEAKELKQLYKDKANIREWASIAEQFGTALAQLGAASYGLRNGINMSGLKFNLTDWDKKHQLALDEYKSDLEDVQGRRKDTLGQMDKEETRRQSLLEDLFKTQVSSSRQAASDKTEQNKAVADKGFQEEQKRLDRQHDITMQNMKSAESLKQARAANDTKLQELMVKMDAEQKKNFINLKNALNNFEPSKDKESDRAKLSALAAEAGVSLPNLDIALDNAKSWRKTNSEERADFVANILAETALPATKSSEVARTMPDGRIAIFDSNTKEFIRWK